jgi:predicted Fe-Mo cluster-binding NifX family protein
MYISSIKEKYMMRIAISADEDKGLDSRTSHHFGRCPYFVLVDVEGEEVQRFSVIANPFFAGHQPGMVPEFIHQQGADVMISGGMGHKAIGFFQQFGIKPTTGATGTVLETLERYFGGEISLAEPCRESMEHRHHKGEHHHGH